MVIKSGLIFKNIQSRNRSSFFLVLLLVLCVARSGLAKTVMHVNEDGSFPYNYLHDDADPDHVAKPEAKDLIITGDVRGTQQPKPDPRNSPADWPLIHKQMDADGVLNKVGKHSFQSIPYLDVIPDVADDVKVVRHRKIFLSSDDEEEKELKITPIDLVIPIDYSKYVVPGPQRMYRMKKITKVEYKPVVASVPVKTTVIKPAGISDNQIIN